MGGIAFVCSGQGDQHPGMGRALCEQYEAAAEMFRLFDALRPGTSAQCFAGTPEALRETINAQPSLFAMELAAAAVLRERGIRPDAVAGFSLGEMAAAALSGVFDAKTGFQLTCRRAEYMQEESEKHDTGMVAVLRLATEQVIGLCARHDSLYPVNFNCPGQVAVSGLASQLPGFSEEVRSLGGRTVPLKVRGAFHSPFMHPAAEAFAGDLASVTLGKPVIPLYSNVTAQPYGDPAELLARQLESPVRWEQLTRNMVTAGIGTFIEIGPGRTLCNMIRKTDPSVRALCVSEMEALLLEVAPC